MNNVHANLDVFNRPEPVSPRLHLAAIESLRIAVSKGVPDLIARLQHRWTMRRIERFSDRRLRDIGFERDWDGTIIPLQK